MTITFIYLLLSAATPLIANLVIKVYLDRKDKALKNIVNSLQDEDRYIKVEFGNPSNGNSVTLEIDTYDPDLPELSELMLRKNKFLRGQIVEPLTKEEDARLNELLINMARKQRQRKQVKN